MFDFAVVVEFIINCTSYHYKRVAQEITFELGVKRTMQNLVWGKGGVVHGMWMICNVQAVVERRVWDGREDSSAGNNNDVVDGNVT